MNTLPDVLRVAPIDPARRDAAEARNRAAWSRQRKLAEEARHSQSYNEQRRRARVAEERAPVGAGRSLEGTDVALVEGWMREGASQIECARRLKVNRSTFAAWYARHRTGTIKRAPLPKEPKPKKEREPGKGRRTLNSSTTVEAIDALRREGLSYKECGERLGFTGRAVAKWYTENGGKYQEPAPSEVRMLADLAQVEAWRNAGMTYKECADRIGVTVSAFTNWYVKYSAQPRKYGGSKFSREDVLKIYHEEYLVPGGNITNLSIDNRLARRLFEREGLPRKTGREAHAS